jgi:hypothetical protein
MYHSEVLHHVTLGVVLSVTWVVSKMRTSKISMSPNCHNVKQTNKHTKKKAWNCETHRTAARSAVMQHTRVKHHERYSPVEIP